MTAPDPTRALAYIGRRCITPEQITTCPDCGHEAIIDMGGDHAGACVTAPRGPATTALDIIRDMAKTTEVFSANDCRPAFDRAGIKDTSRGPAFGMAKRRRYIEPAGHVPSDDAATKGHHIQSYRSLHPRFSPKVTI